MGTPDRFHFTSSDGLPLACVEWSNGDQVRRVVQCLRTRWARRTVCTSAETLAEVEFVIYGNDQPAHGLTAKNSSYISNSIPAREFRRKILATAAASRFSVFFC
jgi:alpha-beta hydrolase superfamily lysophospholipase